MERICYKDDDGNIYMRTFLGDGIVEEELLYEAKEKTVLRMEDYLPKSAGGKDKKSMYFNNYNI